MEGLENRVAEIDTPSNLVPTDPANTVTDNTQGGDDPENDPNVRVDPNLIDLTKLSNALDSELVAAQEMLTRYIALEAWATALDRETGHVSPTIQLGTELLLGLTTLKSGMESADIIPSLEDLSSGSGTAAAIRVYAKKLLEGLIRLGKRIGELFEKIYEILTSRCRSARLSIVAIKAKMAMAKGGRATKKHIGLGSYGRVLAIRGYPINSPGELYGALGAVSTLVDAATVSHLNALLWVGEEIEKIINSDSFPNPAATEARFVRAFNELGKTSLANECTRALGSDPRFQSNGYVTTASENLLGNKTLYLTKPKPGSAISDTFGTVSFELMQSRLGDETYEPKSGLQIPVMELGMARRLLDLCEKGIGSIERFDTAEPGKKLVNAMSTIYRAANARVQRGGLDSNTSDLLYAASVAFSTASTSPIRDLLTHLSTSIDACLDIIDRSVSAYD